jgi:hypothetical protein
MDLILYGDIFLHNIIHHLDLKELSKLKCVCKRYNQIITPYLKQLTIKNIKSKLKNKLNDDYDKFKNTFEKVWTLKHSAKHYTIKIKINKHAKTITNNNYNCSSFSINYYFYNGNYTIKHYSGYKMQIYILAINTPDKILRIKKNIYDNKNTGWYFIENDTDEPFELSDHL